VDIVVIDSVAALVPKAEIEGDGDSLSRSPGRLMSQAMRKLTRHLALERHDDLHQQMREKIGVMYGATRRPRAGGR
jgi:recombination protein RecA